MKDKGLRLALEALEQWNTPLYKRGTVIAAIKQALEQPEPEPEWYHGIDAHGCNHFYYKTEVRPSQFNTPLYTSPPKREPLTDDEIKDAVLQHPVFGFALMSMVRDDVQVQTVVQAVNGIARAIEAAHGIKEKNHDTR